MTIYEIPRIVNQALGESLKPSNITSGFAKTGVYPFNPNVFSDDDYLCSNVTDRPFPLISPLNDFRITVAECLLSYERARETHRNSDIDVQIRRNPTLARPPDATRFDGVGHFPEFTNNRGRCRLCKNRKSDVQCKKCTMHLCINKSRNCFLDFHYDFY